MGFALLSLPLLILHSVFVLSPCFSENVYQNYTSCSKKFSCGTITAGYPFSGKERPEGCGHPELKLICENDGTAYITINDLRYKVLSIDEENQILGLAREDYMNGNYCPSKLANTTMNPSLLELVPGGGNITFYYGCLSSISISYRLPLVCNQGGFPYAQGGYNYPIMVNGDCSSSVVLPTSEEILSPLMDLVTLRKAMDDGFKVKWKVDSDDCMKCRDSKGACGFDGLNQTICFCPNQSSPLKVCPLSPTGSAATTGTTITSFATFSISLYFLSLFMFFGCV